TTDSRTALELYRGVRPDLILLDLMMPHVDGLAVLAQLRAEIPETVFVPVLVLTADVTPDSRRGALAAGAHDFLTKPFEAFEVLLRIGNLLATRRLYLALEEHNRALEDTVRQRPAGEGTGLGLSLCRGIVEEHHGTITVDSEPGRGTTLLIELPVEAPPRAAPRPAAASAPSAVRPGKVLLVDDERAVAEALAEAIRRDGARALVVPRYRRGAPRDDHGGQRARPRHHAPHRAARRGAAARRPATGRRLRAVCRPTGEGAARGRRAGGGRGAGGSDPAR